MLAQIHVICQVGERSCRRRVAMLLARLDLAATAFVLGIFGHSSVAIAAQAPTQEDLAPLLLRSAQPQDGPAAFGAPSPSAPANAADLSREQALLDDANAALASSDYAAAR